MADAPGLADWLREQVRGYGACRSRYEACAALLRKALVTMCREVAPSAQVQARAKALRSFGEKALLVRSTIQDPLHEFVDLCAARVIVSTRQDVQAVTSLLRQSFRVQERATGSAGQILGHPAFGYRSVHLVVSLSAGTVAGLQVPDEVVGLQAELQVRTAAEHVWADFAHDRTYKGQVRLPAEWERELTGLAASLEAVDAALLRLDRRMRDFTADYPAYLGPEETRRELTDQLVLLALMPGNTSLARRVTGLAKALGKWGTVVAVLEPFAAGETSDLVRDLGLALCELHGLDRDGEPFRRGRMLLGRATELDPSDADAWASLAGTYKGEDEPESARLYERAYLAAPENSYPLVNLVEHLLRGSGDLAVLHLLHPAFRTALRRCQERAAVGVDLPWSYLDQGRLHLLLNEDDDALMAYCAGAAAAGAAGQLVTATRSLDILESRFPGAIDCRTLLTLVLLARFDVDAEPLPTLGGRVRPGPITIIIVAGTSAAVRDGVQALIEALEPATHQMVCVADTVRTATMSPTDLQQLVTEVPIVGTTELLELFADVLRYCPTPRTVVFAVGPEASNSLGVRAATVLGLRVGLINGGSEEGGEIWPSAERSVPLPPDIDTIRAFQPGTNPSLPQDMREVLARAVHENLRQRRLRDVAAEPALAGWEMLGEIHRDTSRLQADAIQELVQSLGREVIPLPVPLVAVPRQLSQDEMEQLARAQHGRTCASLLEAGWRWGPNQDPTARTTPSLLPWSELPEGVRQLNRQAAKDIPLVLTDAGLAIGPRPTD